MDCVYPFGFDPAWAISSNDLSISNGIKMKLSVIFAIFHMTMGVVMKGTNTVFHRHWPHFWAEVVTGLIILLGLFGWMDWLIFAKWFYPLEVGSTERIPVYKHELNDKCVLDWPLGKFGDEASWAQAK